MIRSPLDVLSMIRQAGGRVVVLDGDLQIIAPPGTVSAEAAAVLREHKPALLRLLPPAEREAIVWVEALPPEPAMALVEAARREWGEIVGSTEEQAVVLDQHDQHLDQHDQHLDQHGDQGLDHADHHDRADDLDQDAGSWETAVHPPAPCRQCGSLMLWWDFAGGTHCMICEPAVRSERLRERAARLRRRAR